MGSLWRTLSGATSKEISHPSHGHALRPTASMDLAEPRPEDPAPPMRTSMSLPTHSYMSSLESSVSTSTDSVLSSSPATSGGYMASSPTGGGHLAPQPQQQHKQPAQHGSKERKPFKMHGMEPYDYWSMIKSL